MDIGKIKLNILSLEIIYEMHYKYVIKLLMAEEVHSFMLKFLAIHLFFLVKVILLEQSVFSPLPS